MVHSESFSHEFGVLQYLNKPTKKSNWRLADLEIIDFHNYQIVDPGISDVPHPPTATLSNCEFYSFLLCTRECFRSYFKAGFYNGGLSSPEIMF